MRKKTVEIRHCTCGVARENPICHCEADATVGMVILAAPEYRRPLDWEDFDLLRTAGRQAASSLAEAHGQEALSNAQRFEEFNRRYAFPRIAAGRAEELLREVERRWGTLIQVR